MGTFIDAHKIVMIHEGGYANDPNDPGGETYKGVSRKFFPGWTGWALIDQHKTDPAGFQFALQTDGKLEQMVLDFYKTNFWDDLKLDYVKEQPLCVELYDTGVNMGLPIAKRFLQQSLNLNNNDGADYPEVTEDGIIGPATINCVNNHRRPQELFKTLNVYQGARYIDLIKNNAKLKKYWRSWLSRVTTQYS